MRPLRLLRPSLVAVTLAGLVAVAACADEPAPPQVSGDRPAAEVPVVACPDRDPPETDTGAVRYTVDVGDDEREYFLSVPESYDGQEPAPVMLDLHGLQSDAQEQLEYSGLAEADDSGFVVVSPESGGIISGWRLPPADGAADEIAFIEAVLADVGERFCVDPERTYTSGISNGAALSAVLACELAPRIAGVGAVAGVNLVAPCTGEEPVPLIAFHGTDDAIVPYDGGNVLLGLAEALHVEESVAAWADRNGCDPEAEEEDVSAEVRRISYGDCDEDATVELYVVDGGGHTWPGAEEVPLLGHVTDEIDATELIVDRFGSTSGSS